MKSDLRPEFRAVVLTPEPEDVPGDLEDRIHDELVKNRENRTPDGKLAVVQVVLDLSGLEVAAAGPWLKAAGPEIPDANLRVALSEEGYVVARALKLPAMFEWYPSVESALRGGS